MENTFCINAAIAAMRNTAPVRFTHHKSMDQPAKHALHLNDHIEIYIYVAGKHRYMVENTVYELQRGDVIVINPFEVHKALLDEETLYERFYFTVHSNAFDGMYYDPLAAVLRKPSGTGNLISFDDQTREEVLQMLYAVSDCFRDGQNDQLRALGLFLQILDRINRCLNTAQNTLVENTHTPDLLTRILTYIARHTPELQSTTEIAVALGMTPQYLSTYFSKRVGTPLKTYIQAKKIALAKDLLDKGADVTQACFECGFNDCSYFIRVFKKYVGCTPLVYKTDIHKQ